MNDIISTLAVLTFSLALMLNVSTRLRPYERKWVWASYVAHIVSAFALLGVYTFFYTGGDITAYAIFARRANELTWTDPVGYVPELIKAFFRQPSALDPYLYSAGSSTGAMSAATALGFVLTGDSLIGCCMLFAMMSFASKVALYYALRDEFHVKLHPRLLLGLLLVPSAVFWTAGVVKEALAMFGLGFTVLGLKLLVSGEKRGLGLIALMWGGTFVINIKPYIAVPLSVAFGLYYSANRLRDTGADLTALAKKPINVIGGVVFSLGMVWAIGEFFPIFSIDKIAEETARLQQYGERDRGGSTFQIGSGEATSLTQQAMFAPLALINTLFRPFIFEVHNAVALFNGLETAAITLLWGIALYTRTPRGALTALLKVPMLLFCMTFVVLFGVGVGLGTTNLGTLSRYRVPMMPFYVTTLLLMIPYGVAPWERQSSR